MDLPIKRPDMPEASPEASFVFGVFAQPAADYQGNIGNVTTARGTKQNPRSINPALKPSEVKDDRALPAQSGKAPATKEQDERVVTEAPPLHHPQPRKSPVSGHVMHLQDSEDGNQTQEMSDDADKDGETLPETSMASNIDRHDGKASDHSSTTSNYFKKSDGSSRVTAATLSSMTKPGLQTKMSRTLSPDSRATRSFPVQDQDTTRDVVDEMAEPHESDAVENDHTVVEKRTDAPTPQIEERFQSPSALDHSAPERMQLVDPPTTTEEEVVQPQNITATSDNSDAISRAATGYRGGPTTHHQKKPSKSLSRINSGRIQKPKLKTKSTHASTVQQSDKLLKEYQKQKEAEVLQAMEEFRQTLEEKECTINTLRQQNISLSEGVLKYAKTNKDLQTELENKENLLVDHQKKIYKFASYMSSLDKDIPAMRTEQKILERLLRKHLTTDHERLRDEIAESRASIDRIRTKYESIIQALQAEIAHALQQTQDLRKQLGDNAGQLAEERDRSMRFEQQLKLAADSKSSIMEELTKMQSQINAFGTATSSAPKQVGPMLTDSFDAGLFDAVDADAALATEKVLKELAKVEDTFKQLGESYSKRVDELSKGQESLLSAEGPLAVRLNAAITEIVKTTDEMQGLQQRNESLTAENAKLAQQVLGRDGQLVDLVKERDSLLSIRTLLEGKAHKAAEDLAVMQERMIGLANQKPVTGDELQATLLRSENLTLKGELDMIKQSRQRDDSALQNLLQQIETSKLQLAQSEERYNSLVNSHALAVEAALRKHNENIETAKDAIRRDFDSVVNQKDMNHQNEKKQLLNAKQSLRTKLKDAEAELEDLRLKLTAFEQGASSSDADRQLLQEQQEQDRQAIAESKQKIQELQAEAAQLKESKQALEEKETQLITANEKYKQTQEAYAQEIESLREKVTVLETASTQALSEKQSCQQQLSTCRQELKKLQDERKDLVQAKEAAEKELKEVHSAQQQQTLSAKSVLDRLRQDKDDETSKLQDEIARLQSLLQSCKDVGQNSSVGPVAPISSDTRTQLMSPVNVRREGFPITRTKSGVTASGNKRRADQFGRSQLSSQNAFQKTNTQHSAGRPKVQVNDSQRLSRQLGVVNVRDEVPDGTFDDLPDIAPEALLSSRQHVQDTQSTFVPQKTFAEINNGTHLSSTPLSSPSDNPTPPSANFRERVSSSIHEFTVPDRRYESAQREGLLSSGSRASQGHHGNGERPKSNTGNKLTPKAATTKNVSVQFTQDTQFPSSLGSTQRGSTQFQTQNTQNTQSNSNDDEYSYEMPGTPRQTVAPALKRKSTIAHRTSDKRQRVLSDSQSSVNESQGKSTSKVHAPSTASGVSRTPSGKTYAKSSKATQPRAAPKALSNVRSSTPGASQSLNRASTTNANVTTRSTARTLTFDLHPSRD